VVTRLSTTPVKGLRVNHPASVMLEANGAAGDRDFLLVDESGRLISLTGLGPLVRLTATWNSESGRLTVRADDGEVCDGEVDLGDAVDVDFFGYEKRPGRLVLGPWNRMFERITGKRLRLVKLAVPGSGSDVRPVTLLGEASIRGLERASGLHVDPRRFRMLIQFASMEAHVEDTWEGASVHVGSARLRIGATVPRCAATTRNPERGDRDAPVVKAIKDYRGLQKTGFGRGVPFGVYADVMTGGVVRVGDELRVRGEALRDPSVKKPSDVTDSSKR